MFPGKNRDKTGNLTKVSGFVAGFTFLPICPVLPRPGQQKICRGFNNFRRSECLSF